MQNITIGFLFSWFLPIDIARERGIDTLEYQAKNKEMMEGKLIAGAMGMAVELVNNHSRLLPNHTLQFIARNSWSDTLLALEEMTSLMQQGVVAFIGPEQQCHVEAKVASAWNLPMISYVSAQYTVYVRNVHFHVYLFYYDPINYAVS